MSQARLLPILIVLLTGLLSTLFASPLSAQYADHPRIYLTPERIARIQTQHWQANSFEWEKLMVCADRSDMDGARAQALAYAITGDESWAQAAVNVLVEEMIDHPIMTVTFNSTGSKFHNLALVFDWLYHSPHFTTSLKQQLIDYVSAVPMDGSGKWNWYPEGTYFNGVSKIIYGPPLWGLATWGDNPDAEIYIDNGYTSRWTYIRNALGYGPDNLAVMRGGCPPMGLDYGSGTLAYILRYVEAVYTATGVDLYQEAPALKQYLEFYAKSYYYSQDFIRRPEHGHNAHKQGAYLDNSITALLIASDHYRNETEGQWAAWWSSNITGADTYPGESYRYFADADVIFSDNTITQRNPSSEPLAYFAEGNGMWSCRSDWTSGSAEPMTFATFRSGNWTWFNQNHWDQGNFCIYSHGEDLLVDGGVYDGDGGTHVRNYHHQTVAHNCITVRDPGQELGWYFYGWDHAGYKNSGGQNVPYRQTVVDAVLDGVPKDSDWLNYQGYYLHDMSDILRRTHNDRYTYAFADMTNAYANTRWETDYDAGKLNMIDYSPKVDNVTRHWIYLRDELLEGPEYFVTFDRVSSLDASFQKKSLLHFINQPVFQGGSVIGAEVPGNIETWNADRFSMELGGAVLHGAVVLPSDANIRRVGGTGYEWWVEGSNEDAIADYSELGGRWRLEIMPPDENLDDLFLTVLMPTWLGDDAPDVTAISAANAEGASFGDWVVMFAGEEASIDEVVYTSGLIGEQRHLIFDTEPNFQYRVFHNGNQTPIAEVIVGNDGIVEFTSSGGGNFVVTQGEFVPDSTPPTGTVAIAGGSCISSNDAILLLDANDEESGMAGGHMRVSNDGQNWSADLPYTNTLGWDLLPGDGAKTVYVLFADAQGNWMADPASDSASVDSSPPDATFDVVEEFVTTPVVTLNCAAIDNGCGGSAILMAFSNDAFAWSAAEILAPSIDWNLGDSTEGLRTVYARFSDTLGNWSSPILSDEVFLDLPGVDHLPPVPSLFLPNLNETLVTLNTPFACMVQDAHTGVDPASLALSKNGQDLDIEIFPFVGGEYYVIASPDEPLTPFTIYSVGIVAADTAQPSNSVEYDWTFTTGGESRGNDIPRPPEGLVITSDEQCNVEITWEENRDITILGYQVAYGLVEGGEEITLEFQRTIGAHLDEVDDGEYWFGVRALSTHGGLSLLTMTESPIELDCVSPVDPANEDPGGEGDDALDRIWERGEIWPPGVLADRPEEALAVHNLESGWTVRIFTISGKLVHDHTATADGETFTWDRRNNKGHPVSRGIYLVRVYSRSGQADREGKYLLR